MDDITLISEEELRKDLEDSYKDILDCEAALKLGLKTYSGGSIHSRLIANKYFVKVIAAELNRRKKSSVVVIGG